MGDTLSVLENPATGHYLVAGNSRERAGCRGCDAGIVARVPATSPAMGRAFRRFSGVDLRSVIVDSANRLIATGTTVRDGRHRIFLVELSAAANPGPGFNDGSPLVFSPAGQDAVAVASAPSPTGVVTVAHSVGHCRGRAVQWNLNSCGTTALIARNADGDPERSLGGVGFRTDPPTHFCNFAPYRRCGIDLGSRDLKRLLGAYRPRKLIVGGREAQLRLRCPKLVETFCSFNLSISVDANALHLARRDVHVPAGRARSERWRFPQTKLRRLLRAQTIILSGDLKANGKSGRWRSGLPAVRR
jgi:hypothetical protein